MIYKFNNTEINPGQFTLTLNGRLKSVEPKVFDLILYLIKHQGVVLTRQQFFDDVWHGRLVSDATLSNHIKLARAALGDDGEQQAVIKTVRSRGYQLIASVEEVSADIKPPSSGSETKKNNSDAVDVDSSHSHRLLFKTMVVSVVIVAVAAVIFWKTLATPVSTIDTARKVDARPYILVLPFAVSGDKMGKWKPFADQMTRELILDLRKISGLQVVPPASAFTFQNNKTQSHIRQQLPAVRYVLDTVINIGAEGNIRITAELDDITNAKLVWDESYQSRIQGTNFFDVQSEIAASVSDSLKIVILEEERKLLAQVPTSNLAAYEFYVEGQHQLDILTYESLYHAIELFSKAIALDSSFEAAYIAKADSYRLLMTYFEKPSDVLPQVIKAVVEALKINPDSAEARSSLGLAYAFAWRWEDAWNSLNAARERNPQLALTELGFAIYYSGLGDKEGVQHALSRAIELDPLNTEIADWGHWALAMVGETKDATVWAEKQIRLHPKVGMIFSGASVSAAIAGDHERAITLAKRGVELESGSSFALLALAQAYGYAGEMNKVRPLLEAAEKFSGYTCPYESAIVYFQLGEGDKAFSLLNDAVEFRSNCLVFMLNDARLAPLKNDIRYTSILTRVGLDKESIKKYSR